MENKDKIVKNLMDLENREYSVKLLNFYSRMQAIKDEMTDVLDLLDIVAEDSKAKKVMRKKILDSYNELPRKTKKLLKFIIQKEK
ncbi:MAG: hypothetical protein ACOC5T_01165 [Elusimicrobiota bacterium]